MTVNTAVTQRKPTINLLVEYHYQSKSKLRVIEFMWKV